jgi:HSP20 family molecular chaperone IbpA
MTVMRTMGLAPVLPPDATVTETPKEYIVSLPVRGFTQQELEVDIADHVLTIRGNQARTPEDDGSFTLHERIEESFRLPGDVDTNRLNAVYAHRTLEIHAPRVSPRPIRRKVPITQRQLANADVTGL